MKSIKLLAFLILGSAVIAACSNSGNKTNKAATAEIDDVSVAQIIEDLESIPTPTTVELMEMINKLGLTYLYDVTNSLANQESYLSTKQKALNLGVYAADLSYDVAYQKKAETEEYLRCILTMASDLNISIDADKISNKFESNIDNVEGLNSVVKDVFKESQYILNQTSQTETALLFLIGSWVESAYICVSASDLASNNMDFIKVAVSHFEYSSTIIKYLESRKDNSDFAEFFQTLNNLQEPIEALKADMNNLEKFEAVASVVKTMRNAIV
ncbi:MAG: hypothetical protein IKW77_09695 [Salinivirgaceae bacterium]|nr:hypothetical protein [Salinivirgaceae bacterium]